MRLHTLGAFTLAVSPVTHSSLTVPLRLESLASFHRRFMPSHLSLVSCASLYGFSSFLSEVFLRCPGFSSASSSRVVYFGFPYVCSGFSFPVFLFSVFACLWCLPRSYYLLPLQRHLWGSSVHCFPSAFCDPLAEGHAFIFILVVTPSGVP